MGRIVIIPAFFCFVSLETFSEAYTTISSKRFAGGEKFYSNKLHHTSLFRSSGIISSCLFSSVDEDETSGQKSDDQTTSDVFEIPSDVELNVETDVDETSAEIDKIELTRKLLVVASATDRGQFATEEEIIEVNEIISKIEGLQVHNADRPTLSTKIEGTWELLYSNTQLFRSSPFFMAGRAVCQTEEDAKKYDWFCDMHREALAISEIGKVRQIISSDRLVSEFEVKVGSVPFVSNFTPFAYSGGLPVTINGAIVSSADITPTSDGKAWEIFMDSVEIKGSNIPLLREVLDNPSVGLKTRELSSFLENNVEGYDTPKPTFETTYLDDLIRINREQDGKIFVYGKISDSQSLTEYNGVKSDLGISKMLEELNANFFKF